MESIYPADTDIDDTGARVWVYIDLCKTSPSSPPWLHLPEDSSECIQGILVLYSLLYDAATETKNKNKHVKQITL